MKIQQAADYPDEVYSPRGCMKGLSFHLQIYGPDRVRHPLIRTGERGSGEFREATWEEALDHVASELKRIGDTFGYDSIHVFGQVPGSGYVHKGANYRAAAVLGMSHGTSFDYNGDLPMGMPITFERPERRTRGEGLGEQPVHPDRRSQPARDADPRRALHLRRRRGGTRIVVVDPVFSATASKADTFVQIRPGTDAAFALGVAHVIERDGLADERFLRTYTDAPLLVRADTGVRLREADVVAGGSPDRFAVWDETAGSPAFVGTESSGLPPGVTPALVGTFQVPAGRWRPRRGPSRLGARSRRARAVDARVRGRGQRRRRRDDEKVGHAYASGITSPCFRSLIEQQIEPTGTTETSAGRAYTLLAMMTGNIGNSSGRLLGLRRAVQEVHVPAAPSRTSRTTSIRRSSRRSIFGDQADRDDLHESIPYPRDGLARRLFLTFSSYFLVQIAEPDYQVYGRRARRDGARWWSIEPQMTETAKDGRRRPARDDLVREDGPHRHAAASVPAAAAGGDRAGRQSPRRARHLVDLVRRIDPRAWRRSSELTADDAIEMMLAAGDVPGGITEGIALEALRAGPVRLRVPDPDVPFQAQIRDLAPFPPPSPPADLEQTAVFLPTRRIELYRRREERFRELGEQVATHKDPYDDGVHDPATLSAAAAVAALEVADPLHLFEQRVARGDPRRPPDGAPAPR